MTPDSKMVSWSVFCDTDTWSLIHVVVRGVVRQVAIPWFQYIQYTVSSSNENSVTLNLCNNKILYQT